jgi:hypothetical protein
MPAGSPPLLDPRGKCRPDHLSRLIRAANAGRITASPLIGLTNASQITRIARSTEANQQFLRAGP